jgi:hypothetical protein
LDRVVGDRREQRSRSGIDRRIPILAAEILRLEYEIHRWFRIFGFLEINIPYVRLDPKMWRYFL